MSNQPYPLYHRLTKPLGLAGTPSSRVKRPEEYGESEEGGDVGSTKRAVPALGTDAVAGGIGCLSTVSCQYISVIGVHHCRRQSCVRNKQQAKLVIACS